MPGDVPHGIGGFVVSTFFSIKLLTMGILFHEIRRDDFLSLFCVVVGDEMKTWLHFRRPFMWSDVFTSLSTAYLNVIELPYYSDFSDRLNRLSM